MQVIVPPLISVKHWHFFDRYRATLKVSFHPKACKYELVKNSFKIKIIIG